MFYPAGMRARVAGKQSCQGVLSSETTAPWLARPWTILLLLLFRYALTVTCTLQEQGCLLNGVEGDDEGGGGTYRRDANEDAQAVR